MKEYKDRMKALNDAAWLAVRDCPYDYSHPTKSALVRIARETDDLFDDETWGVRDNMPPAEWTAAGGLKAFCKQQGEK